MVDPRNGRLLADRIPGARLVTFPELGHLFFWEDPDGFAVAVTAFLLARTEPAAAAARARRAAWPRRVSGSVGGHVTDPRR